VASRSTIKQFGEYVVVGFADHPGLGTNVRGVRNFPGDADHFGQGKFDDGRLLPRNLPKAARIVRTEYP
jgi:hypothetical protein